jgi:uncharacterized OB-fold protein
MPVRFQVDSDFYDHPKSTDASDAAVALWTRAGSYSAAKLLDGFVPDAMLARLSQTPEDAAQELVRRRLWKRVKGGYRFHEWEERGNLTRDRVETYRQRDRERKKAERHTYEVECHTCGHTYVTARSDSKYCSNVCRKKASRSRTAENQQVVTEVVRTESERNPDGIREDSERIPPAVVSVSVLKTPPNPQGGTEDEHFDTFWSHYPKHTGKKAALKAYRSALKDADAEAINTAAKVFADSVQGKDPRYTPHPSTWLNQGRWEDDVQSPTPPPANDELPAFWRGIQR